MEKAIHSLIVFIFRNYERPPCLFRSWKLIKDDTFVLREYYYDFSFATFLRQVIELNSQRSCEIPTCSKCTYSYCSWSAVTCQQVLGRRACGWQAVDAARLSADEGSAWTWPRCATRLAASAEQSSHWSVRPQEIWRCRLKTEICTLRWSQNVTSIYNYSKQFEGAYRWASG